MNFEGDANTVNYNGTSPFDGGDYSTATPLPVIIERDASEASWVLVAADADDATLAVTLLPPDPIPPPEGNNEETAIIGVASITIQFDDDPTPRASQAIPFPYDSGVPTTISVGSTANADLRPQYAINAGSYRYAYP